MSDETSRRGFLVGAAKVLGTGMVLAVAPPVLARRAEALLWMPDHPDTDGQGINAQQVATVPLPTQGPLYLAVHRGCPTDPILQFQLRPDGGLRWIAPYDFPLRFGHDQRLQELSLYTRTLR